MRIYVDEDMAAGILIPLLQLSRPSCRCQASDPEIFRRMQVDRHIFEKHMDKFASPQAESS